MTYGSGLEFSWRGFRFCNKFGLFIFFSFLFFFVLCFVLVPLSLFDSIRPALPGKEATYALFSLLLHPFHKFFLSSLLFIYFILFCFYFLRFPLLLLLVFLALWFTSAGNPTRTARWTVQCPPVSWPCDRGPFEMSRCERRNVGV